MVYVAFMPVCGCPVWAGVADDPKHHAMVETDRSEFERLGYRIELMDEQPVLKCEHVDMS